MAVAKLIYVYKCGKCEKEKNSVVTAENWRRE